MKLSVKFFMCLFRRSCLCSGHEPGTVVSRFPGVRVSVNLSLSPPVVLGCRQSPCAGVLRAWPRVWALGLWHGEPVLLSLPVAFVNSQSFPLLWLLPERSFRIFCAALAQIFLCHIRCLSLEWSFFILVSIVQLLC